METNLISSAKYLSGQIGARSYRDIPRLNKTADYIENAFRSYGCSVTRQAFQFNTQTYYNIIAEVKGKDQSKQDILIIGAHYDTVIDTPGADDNASGVAGLLELAKLTARHPTERTVRFAAFSLEEPPAFGTEYMGSYAYAKSIKLEGVEVYGMISFEMIGYFCEEKGCQAYPLSFFDWFLPNKGNFISFVGNFSSRSFIREVKKSFAKASTLPVETLSAFSGVTGVDFSDHRNFWKFGFNAFMITDTAFYRYPHYHGTGDTWEKLDYKKMEKLITGQYKAMKTI